MMSGDEFYPDDVTSGPLDDNLRCRFCHRYVVDGLYTRVTFPDGIANVCDNCHEKRDEDTARWRDTDIEVAP